MLVVIPFFLHLVSDVTIISQALRVTGRTTERGGGKVKMDDRQQTAGMSMSKRERLQSDSSVL